MYEHCDTHYHYSLLQYILCMSSHNAVHGDECADHGDDACQTIHVAPHALLTTKQVRILYMSVLSLPTAAVQTCRAPGPPVLAPPRLHSLALVASTCASHTHRHTHTHTHTHAKIRQRRVPRLHTDATHDPLPLQDHADSRHNRTNSSAAREKSETASPSSGNSRHASWKRPALTSSRRADKA